MLKPALRPLEAVLVVGVSCSGKSRLIDLLLSDPVLDDVFSGFWYMHFVVKKYNSGEIPNSGARLIHLCLGFNFFKAPNKDNIFRALNIQGAIIVVATHRQLIARASKKIKRLKMGQNVDGDGDAFWIKRKLIKDGAVKTAEKYKLMFAYLEGKSIPFFIVYSDDNKYKIIEKQEDALKIILTGGV